MNKPAEGSQATTDESGKEGSQEQTTEEKLYPKEGEQETPEQKEAREAKEAEDKATEEAATALKERAEKVGLKEGATEEEIKAAEDKAAEDAKPKSIAELQDAAQTAMDKYQSDPTPENKKAADEAIAASKKAVEAEKNSKIEYDVKAPDESVLSEKRLEEIVAFARERGFSNEIAQSMVDIADRAVLEQTKEATETIDKMVSEEWPKQCAEDKEIGGDDFNKNAELSKRVLQKYAPPEFIDLLDPRTKENPNGTSYGNHPLFMKFLVRIGKSMTDDQLILSKEKGAVKKSVAETFYGPNKKED